MLCVRCEENMTETLFLRVDKTESVRIGARRHFLAHSEKGQNFMYTQLWWGTEIPPTPQVLAEGMIEGTQADVMVWH